MRRLMIARSLKIFWIIPISSQDVWADSAYRSGEKLDHLSEHGFREHIQRKGYRNKKLTDREKSGNHTRSKIRSRVEHIFSVQSQRAGSLLIRSIGLVRAKNEDRFA